jgi:hypothetical protein
MQTKFAVIRQQSRFIESKVTAKAGRTGSTNRAGRPGKEKPWLTCHEKILERESQSRFCT